MCGICGQFNYSPSAPVSIETLSLMTGAIAHRGPDDGGYFQAGPIGFGFRRLSIIDLAGGHQPMSDVEETVWIVFNGEIYNFRELRQELEAHGHAFRTQSDTEVVINGYKQWGDEVFNRLNGMFGLAIWDVRRRRLIVARDPFGIKSVYYRLTSEGLFFGSELRAVLASSDEPLSVDPAALNLFLSYRFTPSPHTILKGVRKLAPGTLLDVDARGCRVRRWYCYRPKPFAPPKSDAEALSELSAIYRRALKRHLIADVPVGLLLSGGIDSGLLLALMNENGDSWRTYTVGYGSSYADDELADAAETARRFNCVHADVQIDRRTFERALPLIVSAIEEPIASSSVVPMYFVCQRARQDVKVALTGQGPDELFGGYRRHLGVRYGALWAGLPTWMRRAASRAIEALPRNETLKRGVHALDVPERLRRYQAVLSLIPGDRIDGLFQPGLLDQNVDALLLDSWAELAPLMDGTDELGGLQYLELRSTLPDELLMYSDKLSMAHGLEVRVPYLDRELVEYVERLPARFKVRHGTRKWLHRRLAGTLLPAAVLKRKKRGFGVNVVDAWFRNTVSGDMEEMLLDRESRIYGYLRAPAVSTLLREHREGRNDNHKVLFSLVLLEYWLRQVRVSRTNE